MVALYLELLKRALLGEDLVAPAEVHPTSWRGRLVAAAVRRRGYRIVDPARLERPMWAGETMVGRVRLDNIQDCIESVLREEIPGDLIETGVWRGGAAIFMRAVLAAHAISDRMVWAADSFCGLPEPTYEADRDQDWTLWIEGHSLSALNAILAVDLDTVRSNFDRYGLLDEHVRFLPGWFSEVLPAAPIEKLALLRMDGDMYESTRDALSALYPKLSAGGYAIVDDYYAYDACRLAVDQYRTQHRVTEPIVPIDMHAVYWRKAVA